VPRVQRGSGLGDLVEGPQLSPENGCTTVGRNCHRWYDVGQRKFTRKLGRNGLDALHVRREALDLVGG
jgi:hypothetical protein